MNYNLTHIGRWALIGGLILCILAALTTISYLLIFLFVLGLIVGLLNITEKESTPFLVAVITLLLVGVSGLQLGGLTELVSSIFQNFIAFIAAAGLVVALKQISVATKPSLQK
ncbi:MAG: hypothetical protein ABIC82_05450 [bacterium]